MSDAPDLRDSSGRLRRIAISLVAGAACGALAYVIANAIIDPASEARVAHVSTRQMDGGTFVLWIALVTGAVSVSIAAAIQNALARKKWRDEGMVPKAKVR